MLASLIVASALAGPTSPQSPACQAIAAVAQAMLIRGVIEPAPTGSGADLAAVPPQGGEGLGLSAEEIATVRALAAAEAEPYEPRCREALIEPTPDVKVVFLRPVALTGDRVVVQYSLTPDRGAGGVWLCLARRAGGLFWTATCAQTMVSAVR